MVKIKVCGITNLDDAEKSLEFGADMLGFNFYPPSPRCIAPEKAREIIACLPRDSFNVALFVNEPRARVNDVLAAGRLPDGRQAYRGLQFHGEEDRVYCRGWVLKVIKAFRIKEQASLVAIKGFPADYYLLDSFSAGFGGSGQIFPWEWLDGIDSGKILFRAAWVSTMSPRRSAEFNRSESMSVAAWKRVQVLKIMANSKNLSLLPKVPDRRGHFGPYGGRYVAETLMPALTELERGYAQVRRDAAFHNASCVLSP